MKYICIFFIASLIVVSCSNNNQPKQEASPALSTTDSLKKEFLPIIVGNWVPADYIDNLKKTLSPYKSFLISNEDWGVFINTKDITGDSLPIVFSHGGAGPGQCTLYFIKGVNSHSVILKAPYELDSCCACLGYKITSIDTTLILYKYNLSRTKLLSQREYKRPPLKLNADGETTPDAMLYYINKIIFSGKYMYTDSAAQQHTAQFDDLGNIKGIKEFKTYFIEQDYGQGPGVDTDIVTLSASGNVYNMFLFKLNRDTLKLFDYNYNDSLGIYTDLHLSYTLIKQ